MDFKRKSQLYIALIVMTTFMSTVCDSRPEYCQCISSDGNPFSAFAEYSLGSENLTTFWLYQNKHRCKLFRNQTELVVDTSGQIEKLDHVYRRWFGFYFKDSVYECRVLRTLTNFYEMKCRKAAQDWHLIDQKKHEEDFETAVIFIEKIDGNIGKRIDFTLLNQKYSNGKWNRTVNTYRLIEYPMNRLMFIQTNSTSETILTDIIHDIDDKLYINAVISAFDAKNHTKGFFIFVTKPEGIYMYCYKSHTKEQTDRCKLENMTPLMSECNVMNKIFFWIFLVFIAPLILCLIAYSFWLITNSLLKAKYKRIEDINSGNNTSNIDSKVESKVQSTLPFSVHTQPLETMSTLAMERPVDLVKKKKVMKNSSLN